MPTNNYPGVGYNNTGYDYNFFQIVAVNTATFGGGSADGKQPDLIITFHTQGIQLLNLGSGIVEFSFNGNVVHGQLDSSNASGGLTFDNRVVSKIWFRIKTGSSGPINVSVNAWATC